MNSKSAVSSHANSRPDRRRRDPGWRKAAPYAAATVLLGLLVAGFWPRPVRVETAEVVRGALTVSVLEEGKTRIRQRYVVSAPVAGLLERIEWRAGAPIEAGRTVLATITAPPAGPLDPRARAEAEARVQAAEAAQQLRESELERVRAAFDLAQKEFARADQLRETGSISAQEWDAAATAQQVRTREVRAAEFALSIARFEVEQSRARLLQEESAAGGTRPPPVRLVAPVNGYLLNVFEESARVVAPGTPLVEVGDPRDLEAEIELLSSDAVAVSPGADVAIERWGGDAPLRGRVVLVEPGGFTKYSALGVEEQRVKVRVEFLEPPPPGRELGDRYRVEARIVTWHDDDVLQVPTGALFRRGGDWMAFVAEDGNARLRPVVIGHNNGIAAEVRAGLATGERVVVHPPDTVADGTAVTDSE